jgi:carbamate kinase
MSKLAIIAIGGNSLIKSKDKVSIADQYIAIEETAVHITDIIEQGYNVVVTHGNGPQVGYILRRAEIARDVTGMHTVPLVNCGADTQGAIGYQIQQALTNEFKRRRINRMAVTLVTQVRVDSEDEAFNHPMKPIGSFYTEEELEVIKSKNSDWVFMEDAGRGFRRVVASPKPLEIVEADAIKSMIKSGFCVVAVGGGGIPVVEDSEGMLIGMDAVIDKDFATSLLAYEISADLLIISTGVEKVCLNFGQPNQIDLDHITLKQLKSYRDEGHFAPGSMLPKIEAVINFLEKGGQKAIITSPENLKEALENKTGTHITL